MHRQVNVTLHHLHRLGQTLPVHGGTQDVMAFDHTAQGTDEVVEVLAVVELHHRAQQVSVAFLAEQVMEQDAFLHGASG